MKLFLIKKLYYFFVYNLCLTLIITGISSCSSNIKNVKGRSAENGYILQVNTIQDKITLLENEIQKIKNTNMRYHQLIEQESSYNREPLTLKNMVQQNENLIKKYSLLIKRYHAEIRVIKRKNNS